MKDKFEQLFYFGLGSALMAKEKFEKACETACASREESERKAQEFFDDAVAKGSEHREQMKGKLKELLKEAVDELGLATRADVEALRAEVAKLREGQS